MKQRLLFKGLLVILMSFVTGSTFAQTESGTENTDLTFVPAPMIKTLTYSTQLGKFSEEAGLTDGVPYYGCIAVNAAYADESTGAFLDMSDKVSGIIYKFDEKAYTKQDFISGDVAGITTVSTRSALITTEGHTKDLWLSVIAYHIVGNQRYYSEVLTRKYKYTEPGARKELTLSCSESPLTLELTTKGLVGDLTGLFTDSKRVTITAKAKDGDAEQDVTSALHFLSRSSNRKLALSHMVQTGGSEFATVNNNSELLINNGQRAGVITVLIATEGNDDCLPAFVKVNVVLKDNTITAMADAPDRVYTSIADLRTAGRQNKSKKCIIQFPDTNPATVVARFINNDENLSSGKEGQNNIFITDNSGYGLMIPYKDAQKEVPFIDGTKYGDGKPLATGTSFTGTICCTYKERTSQIPEISEISESLKIGTDVTATTYTTAISVERSGEGEGLIGVSIPITSVADIYTINKQLSGDELSKSYRPYLNTVVAVPGIIAKDGEQYVLLQSGHSTSENNYKIYLNANQLEGVNLENYVGLEGIFTGLLTKRDGSSTKLSIVRSSFFEAEELDEFLLDETLPEGRVADRYNTGALSNKVTAKIHRKGWTTDTWGTICLPFDMTAAEFEATFGQGITALATCNDKVSDAGALSFTELETKDIKAGVPYLIKVNGVITNGTGSSETDDNYYATIADREITVPVPSVVTVSHVDANGDAKNPIVGKTFEFRGLFGKKTVASEANAEGGHDPLAGNQKYQYISTAAGQYLHYIPSGSTAAFAGLRAYLYFPEWNSELNDAANAGSTQNKALTIGIGDGTTGINGIVVKELGDGKVFNLSGQYVGSTTEGLSKGIYIRNGKKFVVK